jgi:nucleotide-binding universal stress UspA family protein
MNVLLILSQERAKKEATDYCLDLLKREPGKLLVVYVLDSEFSGRIETQLADSFVAEKPGQDMAEALDREYRQRAARQLQTIEAQCEKMGVSVLSSIKPGAYLEVIKDAAAELNPDLVVISETRKGFMDFVFGRRDQRDLSSRITVPIKAF